MPCTELGRPLWHDLTVKDATRIVPFYEAVCGWKASEHDMGDYVDFDMTTKDGDRVAGLCQARHDNAAVPPVWMMYVAVQSLQDALAQVALYGGDVVAERHGVFAIVRDPAGAHLALWEQRA